MLCSLERAQYFRGTYKLSPLPSAAGEELIKHSYLSSFSKCAEDLKLVDKYMLQFCKRFGHTYQEHKIQCNYRISNLKGLFAHFFIPSA
jgi:hypothetical protein